MNIFRKKHIALIHLDGTINQKMSENFRSHYEKLVKDKNKLLAVGLTINSRGGSAVYSEIIGGSLRTFCDKNNLKLITFAESVAASGGYWILSYGHEAYAKEASIVGSVGVIMASTNIKGIADNYDIKRRFFTSKESGSDFHRYSDPFLDKNPEDQEFLKEMISKTHDEFKNHVLSFRNDKIIKDENIRKEIFNANVYLGEKCQELGLIDGLSSYQEYFKQKFKGIKIRNYSKPKLFGSGIMKLNFDIKSELRKLHL